MKYLITGAFGFVGTHLVRRLRLVLPEAIAECKPPLETDPELVRPVENEVVIGSHAKITAAIGWRPTIALEDSLRSVYLDWLERI